MGYNIERSYVLYEQWKLHGILVQSLWLFAFANFSIYKPFMLFLCLCFSLGLRSPAYEKCKCFVCVDCAHHLVAANNMTIIQM